MANILTADDFVGEVEIPTGEWIDSKLDLYIAQVEEDILISLLGYTLYDEFVTALAGTPASKWTDLRDGGTYTSGDRTYYFKGILEMLKYFTFFYYMRDNGSENTQVGIAINETTNADRNPALASSIMKRIWNKGIDIYCDAASYITIKNEPTEIYADFYYTHRDKLTII
jgi:hypothetical protein